MNINTNNITKLLKIIPFFSLLFFLSIVILIDISQAESCTLSPSGGAHDEQLINDAIDSYETIYLSPGTYYLSESLYLHDNTKIIGAGMNQTTIRAYDPVIFAVKGAAMIYINDKNNGEISALTIHGGETPATHKANSGHDWENAIRIDGGSSGWDFHNILFTFIDGDAVRAGGYTSNNNIYNCIMETTGHDGAQIWGGDAWHIYNNKMNLFINSGVRFANSENCELDRNTFYCDTYSGFVYVELENTTTNINIHHNLFLESNNPYNTAVATVHSSGDADIHENIFYGCTPYSLSGITYTFENNAYELGGIEGAGYNPEYSANIIDALISYTEPIRNVFSSPSMSESSEGEDTLNTESMESSTESPGMPVIQFLNALLSSISEIENAASEFITCLFIMLIVYSAFYIFSRVLN